jgi:signal transduction histidine kinase
MKRLLLLFCVMAVLCADAQKAGQARIDSLLVALPRIGPDTLKIKALIDLSSTYADINAAESIKYGEQAIALAEKSDFTQGLIEAYNTLGISYKVKGDYARSIDLHGKALALAEKKQDKKSIAVAYGGMGTDYLFQGAYPKSLEHYLKAMKINEEINFKAGMASNIGNIGNVYSYLLEYDKALDYYERAMRLFEELGNKRGAAANLGNAGYIYIYKKNYDKALQYINRALVINEEIPNNSGITGNAQGLGRIYQAQHNFSKAVESFEKSLRVAQKQGNKVSIAQNLLTIGEVYLAAAKDSLPSPFTGTLSTPKGLLAKALENANQAISLRGEMKDMNGLNFAYDTKSQIEIASGDAVGALASYQEHIRYRDSVFNTEKAKEINRRELQYEFGKREDSIKYQQLLTNEKLVQQELLGKQQQQQLSLKQQQLLLINKEKDLQKLTYLQKQAQLQREKEIQASLLEKNQLQARLAKEASDKRIASQQLQIGFDQKMKIFLAIAVGLAVCVAFLVLYNQQKTQKLNRIIGKQKSELEELGQVKDRLFSVVSHDMRSPVNSLVSFIDILEDGDIPAAKLKTYAAELKNQLSHTSVLMDNLLNWASSQMKGFTPVIEPLELASIVDETLNLLQQQAGHKQIRLGNHIPKGIRVQADRNMLSVVIRNLVNNGIKYTPAGGRIDIRALQQDGKVDISVTDDGTGMPLAKVTRFNDAAYLHSIESKRGTQGETGTGLGLFLCKTFAALMKGTMSVESQEKAGSSFTLVLPTA